MAFVTVAGVDSVAPGTGKMVEAGGRELALFNVDGEFHCIDNLCPHRLGPLAEGELEDDVVSCPWHAWQINVRSGEVMYSPGVCVARFDCRVENGAVQVDLPETDATP